jgi:hypothetical protein
VQRLEGASLVRLVHHRSSRRLKRISPPRDARR